MPWKERDVVNLRKEFVLRSLEVGVVLSDLCTEYGISRKTGYKWRQRFLEDGVKGLHDGSRRPLTSPDQLTEATVCELIRLKLLHRGWGPKKITDLYQREHNTAVSISSCQRVLGRAGLVQRRRKRRQQDAQRLEEPVEVKKPNDLWTVDFKGWWLTSRKRRCEPLTVRDEYSKFILALRAVHNTRTESIQAEFQRVFGLYGLPSVIRSDNGRPFACTRSPMGLTRLSAWWISLGIRLHRTRPGHPQDNGSHERMHLDIRNELQGLIEGELKDHQHAFDIWSHEFNCVRPHEALKMKRPAEVYRKSTQPYRPDVQIEYPPGFLTRKVNQYGQIRFNSYMIRISEALTGWDVGLKYIKDRRWELWFDYLKLGEVDLSALAFIRAGQIG